MDRDAANISTQHQPEGSGRNPSDTLDKPATSKVAAVTDESPARPGAAPVVDEKGRPLSGEGLATDKAE